LSSASDWCLAAATLLALACATCCSRIFARPHFIARQHACSHHASTLARSHRALVKPALFLPLGVLTVARSRSYTRTSA
jgi:hypothetical protein